LKINTLLADAGTPLTADHPQIEVSR